MAPSVSLIIPTYRRADKLARLMSDLNRQLVAPETFEVLVVDDGSPEDPTPAVAALPLRYTWDLLRLPNGGPARARNRALERAKGDLILILNDDATVAPGLIAAHLATHEDVEGHAAVLGAFCYSEALRKHPFTRLVEDLKLSISTRHLHPGRYYTSSAFWTCNLSLKRALLEAVGGFDESFPEPSHEDIEIGIRLERQFGLRVRYTDRAWAYHDHQMELGSWRRQKYMGGRNAYRVYRKHRLQPIPALEDAAGDLSDERLELGWTHYQEMKTAVEQLQRLIEQLLQPGGENATGTVAWEGRTWNIPQERSALLEEAMQTIYQKEALGGFIEAARGERGLGPDVLSGKHDDPVQAG